MPPLSVSTAYNALVYIIRHVLFLCGWVNFFQVFFSLLLQPLCTGIVVFIQDASSFGMTKPSGSTRGTRTKIVRVAEYQVVVNIIMWLTIVIIKTIPKRFSIVTNLFLALPTFWKPTLVTHSILVSHNHRLHNIFPKRVRHSHFLGNLVLTNIRRITPIKRPLQFPLCLLLLLLLMMMMLCDKPNKKKPTAVYKKKHNRQAKKVQQFACVCVCVCVFHVQKE